MKSNNGDTERNLLNSKQKNDELSGLDHYHDPEEAFAHKQTGILKSDIHHSEKSANNVHPMSNEKQRDDIKFEDLNTEPSQMMVTQDGQVIPVQGGKKNPAPKPKERIVKDSGQWISNVDPREHRTFSYEPNPGPWIPYEDCSLEMPLYRWTGRWFFKVRYTLTNWIRFSLFRFMMYEVTIGGILIVLIVFGLHALYGIYAYSPSNSTPVLNADGTPVLDQNGKPKLHWPNIYTSGNVASVAVVLLFSVCGKNSIWGFLWGISWERILVWHKIFTWLVIGTTIYHAVLSFNKVASFRQTGGFIMLACFGFIGLFSMIIRQYPYYRIFWIVHRFFLLPIVVLMGVHGAYFCYIGIGLWIFDVIFRHIWMCVNRSRQRTATAVDVSKKIIELRFPRGNFHYAAGQYIFLTLPKLSWWEPHPFSISSAPFMKDVNCHIRILGDWTRDLLIMCRHKIEIPVYIDGPYGSPSVDIENPSKKMFMLIAGGVGVTPILSQGNALIDQYVRGRDIKKIFLFWACKEAETIAAVVNDQDVMTRYHAVLEDLQALALQKLNPDVLDIEIYVSKAGRDAMTTSKSDGIVIPEYERYFIQKRMNLKEAFKRVKEEQEEAGLDDVIVMCCGPNPMMHEASRRSKVNGWSHHLEVFEF